MSLQEKKSGDVLEDCVRHLTEIADLSMKLDTFIDDIVMPMVPNIPEDAVQSMRGTEQIIDDGRDELRVCILYSFGKLS